MAPPPACSVRTRSADLEEAISTLLRIIHPRYRRPWRRQTLFIERHLEEIPLLSAQPPDASRQIRSDRCSTSTFRWYDQLGNNWRDHISCRLSKSSTGTARLWQELAETTGRTGRANLRSLLRDWGNATLHLARTGEYSQTPVDSCRRIQQQPGSPQDVGPGKPRELKNWAPDQVWRLIELLIKLCRPRGANPASPRAAHTSRDPSRSITLLCLLRWTKAT